MRIGVPESVLDTIRAEAEAGYPHEVCGFLVGTRSGGDARVHEARPAANTRGEEARTRYLIDPETYREAERQADREGRDVVGFYHSHPDAPARPSAYDLDHAWPWVAYVIVAVEDGLAAEATAWRLADDRSRFDPLEIDIEDHVHSTERVNDIERSSPCPES